MNNLTPEDILRRDTKFIDLVLIPIRPSLKYIFRVEASGLEKLEDRPYLLVANHNIGAAVEVLALLDIWHTHRRAHPAYGLTHRFTFKIPGLRGFFSKLGSVPASYEAAEVVLDSGASLIIFPGGNWEASRPYSQRGMTDFAGHKGWARIALKHGVEVVPISIQGSHSVNPIFVRSETLATVFVFPRLLGIRYFPISLTQIVWGAGAFLLISPTSVTWAVVVATFLFIFSALCPILPAKIRIRFGEPVDLRKLSESVSGEEGKIQMAYDVVTGKVQEGLDSLS